MSVPLTKLLIHAVRTVTKPIAKRMADEAGKHPSMKRALIASGQIMHTIMARLYILGASSSIGQLRVLNVKPLEEDVALQRGAEILSEGIMFAVGTVAIIWEYRRSKRKEAEKESEAEYKEQKRREEVAGALRDLEGRLSTLEEHSRQIAADISAIRHQRIDQRQAQVHRTLEQRKAEQSELLRNAERQEAELQETVRSAQSAAAAAAAAAAAEHGQNTSGDATVVRVNSTTDNSSARPQQFTLTLRDVIDWLFPPTDGKRNVRAPTAAA